MSLQRIRQALQQAAKPGKKEILQKFFKTGLGEYAEGDIFLGVMVPDTRKIAKRFLDIAEKDLGSLLKSRIHEERLLALLILVERFGKATFEGQQKIIKFYLMRLKYVNNWDLVDLTAPRLVGKFLLDKDRSMIYNLAHSKNLWERRIAMVATYEFIRRNDFKDALKIAKILMNDRHDLMHKAVGWMLREIGKKDENALRQFLKKNKINMPRTTLRYAIERFPEKERREWLQK